jgi:hypothetical protein
VRLLRDRVPLDRLTLSFTKERLHAHSDEGRIEVVAFRQRRL